MLRFEFQRKYRTGPKERWELVRKGIYTAKLQNGKYGLRAWYPNLKPPKETSSDDADAAGEAPEEGDTTTPRGVAKEPPASPRKGTAAA